MFSPTIWRYKHNRVYTIVGGNLGKSFMEKLELISIFFLLDKVFFIPSYQRGYRWEKRQVLDLLEDILEFQKKDKEKGEFYCLQPIVVTKKENLNWEVIDGQQRLTTLHIILSYLEDARKIMFNTTNKYSISYETREKSNYSSKIFLEEINNVSNIDNHNIDFYHISKAYLTIKEWFEKNQINKADFLNTLLKKDFRDKNDIANNIRFIWYEVETKDKNESKNIFTRINMGKIPLTNAELIKALFFINREQTEKEREKYQQKIAYEWDNIENSLQNNNFWFFLNKQHTTKPTKIEFIFDLIADKYKQQVSVEINKSIDNYYTFYIFNYLISENIKTKDELWDEIKTYFRTFEEWYNNNQYYHFIGYLIHIGKQIKDIIELANNKSKSEFKNALAELIKNDINKDFEYQDINEMIELSYQEHYNTVTKILLFFNVITTMNSRYTKFPFERYIDENWSLEHIHAQNSEELRTDKQRKQLLNDQKTFFENLSDNDILYKISEMLEKQLAEDDEFTELQNEIFKKYSDDINVHSINNLALLATDDNSALSNNIFPIKRDKIIKLDEKGSFIPICTKNVFLKYYTKDVTQSVKWTEKDRKAYLSEIANILKDFLPEYENEN